MCKIVDEEVCVEDPYSTCLGTTSELEVGERSALVG